MNRRDFLVGLVGAVVAGELVERLAAEEPLHTTAAAWGDKPMSIEEMQRLLLEVYRDALDAFPLETPLLAKLQARSPRSLFNPPPKSLVWTVSLGR